MGEATVIILHPGADGEGPLTRLLAEARDRLVAHQARLFEHAGVHVVRIERGAREASFGERLVGLGGGGPGGLIILGAGAVTRLAPAALRRGRAWPRLGGGSCSSPAEPRPGRWPGWSATSRAESASWPRSAASARRLPGNARRAPRWGGYWQVGVPRPWATSWPSWPTAPSSTRGGSSPIPSAPPDTR